MAETARAERGGGRRRAPATERPPILGQGTPGEPGAAERARAQEHAAAARATATHANDEHPPAANDNHGGGNGHGAHGAHGAHGGHGHGGIGATVNLWGAVIWESLKGLWKGAQAHMKEDKTLSSLGSGGGGGHKAANDNHGHGGGGGGHH